MGGTILVIDSILFFHFFLSSFLVAKTAVWCTAVFAFMRKHKKDAARMGGIFAFYGIGSDYTIAAVMMAIL